jgi:hypothetical protein
MHCLNFFHTEKIRIGGLLFWFTKELTPSVLYQKNCFYKSGKLTNVAFFKKSDIIQSRRWFYGKSCNSVPLFLVAGDCVSPMFNWRAAILATDLERG